MKREKGIYILLIDYLFFCEIDTISIPIQYRNGEVHILELDPISSIENIIK